jgi:hypothetical protein
LDSRHDDSINSRMRRVELWRDQYAKAVGAHFGMLCSLIFISRYFQGYRAICIVC